MPSRSESGIPSRRSLEINGSEDNHDTPGSWESYYDELVPNERIFREQARSYVRRLKEELPFHPGAKILDFGCGCGFVADLLAPQAAMLFLWDSSANMRQRARMNTAHHENVRFLDFSDSVSTQLNERFDLILVNSVVQYMAPDEFSHWLKRWKNMLSPGGRLLISDIIPLKSQYVFDLWDFFAFCVRKGLVLPALRVILSEYMRYQKVKGTRSLRPMGRDELIHKAAALGCRVEFLSRNLSHLGGRYTAILSMEKRNDVAGQNVKT